MVKDCCLMCKNIDDGECGYGYCNCENSDFYREYVDIKFI